MRCGSFRVWAGTDASWTRCERCPSVKNVSASARSRCSLVFLCQADPGERAEITPPRVLPGPVAPAGDGAALGRILLPNRRCLPELTADAQARPVPRQ